MNYKNNITESIINLPRLAKQIVAILCDFSLCLIAVVGAFYLRLDYIVALKGPVITAAWVSVIIALPIFWLVGLYRTIFRFSGLSIAFTVSIGVLVYALLYICIFTLYAVDGIPRSIGILQPMLLFFGVIFSRLFVKFILQDINKEKKRTYKSTIIYGAGIAGRDLAISLNNSFEFRVIGFIDDDKKLQGQYLFGKKIYNPNNLEKLINSKNIDLVLLALPSITRFRRNKILENLRKYKIQIHTLPSAVDIIHGKYSLSDIKELDVNDILNREIVPPNKYLLYKNITNQRVMVTGAGGSIGSEICRQIIKGNPESIILCELNEFVLYNIYEELKNLNQKVKIFPLLLNIQDENKINQILKIFKIQTVYHAAAYKHVPLVESNISEGVLNNVFGTYSLVKACIQQNISNFVLVSSDKAVRPTNIMGATKRLSEICLQALYYQYQDQNIKMSIVRFGNVLESSGSVIPKFKQQIKKGGPVTLTHPEVTRYFMTITEAAQLVMQAGAMSENCDVFILDMGKSVKIKDLITRIINLSGLSVKDENNPEGDIEIKLIGLRVGEKLYEELLLGDNPQPTQNKKIQKASDPYIPLDQLKNDLDLLKLLCIKNHVKEVKTVLEKLIDNYQSEYEIIDPTNVERSTYAEVKKEIIKTIN